MKLRAGERDPNSPVLEDEESRHFDVELQREQVAVDRENMPLNTIWKKLGLPATFMLHPIPAWTLALLATTLFFTALINNATAFLKLTGVIQ